jgi:hypothetical protein
MILALAALGLMSGVSNAAVSVQCDRSAVFQTCNYGANNVRTERTKKDNAGANSGAGDVKGGHNNNGYGNGDQDAPGKSGSHNNAENSGHQNHHGNH